MFSSSYSKWWIVDCHVCLPNCRFPSALSIWFHLSQQIPKCQQENSGGYRELDPPQKKDVQISSPKTFNKLHDYHPDGAWLSSGWGRSRQESCEEKLDRHKAMVFWVPLGHHLGDPFLHRQVRKASSWEKDWWTIHPRNHFSHLQSI